MIVNLTYPESHFLISSEAMKHGKHVYCEKMMAPTFEEATELAHLAEKYAEGGYLKLYIPESANAEHLAQFRALIADAKRLREAFERIFAEETAR